MDTEQRILCLAARTELHLDARDRLRALLGAPPDWERLWAQAHLHDVVPLVTATLRALAGEELVPEAWMARGERRLLGTLVGNRALQDELIAVVRALGEVGVEALPVKGIVLAQHVYGSLALRPAADLDVLVQPRDLPAARAVLGSLGYRHRERLLFEEAHHAYHDPQYFRDAGGVEVCLELHRALWDARHFRHDDGIWDRAVGAELAGVPIQVLSPEDTLLHLAIHRTRSPLRLRLLCDVAELLRRQVSTLAWDALLARAHQVGARTALHAVLVLARDLLDAPVPPDAPERLAVTRPKRWVVERTCGRRALFRRAADDDLGQQPRLVLRAFEQDGLARVALALGRAVPRKGHKRVWARRQQRAGIA